MTPLIRLDEFALRTLGSKHHARMKTSRARISHLGGSKMPSFIWETRHVKKFDARL
jgi:hypothetical protein